MADFLNDSLDNLFEGAGTFERTPVRQFVAPVKQVYTEPCPSCHGTGRWKGIRPCFKCNSKGTLQFRTARATRVALTAKRVEKKAKTQAENVRDFQTAYPAQFGWLQANSTNSFAKSLYDQVVSRGELSDKQFAAIDRSLASVAARKAEASDRVVNAPSIQNFDKIIASFDAARASGLKRMALRYKGLVLKAAGVMSANAGGIYVTFNGAYAGKIMTGKWLAIRGVAQQVTDLLLEFAIDPHKAAIDEGKRTGNCCCCGKLLTVKRSVEMGIGPICETKWGW